MTRDPLLQPFRLKHLTLKNRIMSTAHERDSAEMPWYAPISAGA